MDTATHALVNEGSVEQGWVIELETVPMLFLREAPLVDGEWMAASVRAVY